jgi:xylose dehydrogenase (NAD/NADP)
MKDKLRWGLLGTARINRSVIPPLRTSPRNELAAVASRSAEKAGLYAREWRIPRVYGSYEALLADPEIDVIYNSLPNSLHAEWTIKAMEAGKHVLCEKPLALSLEEVDAIGAAAQKTGKVVTEAFMYRHHPQTLKVKQLLDNGAIGAIQMVSGVFTFYLEDPNNVRMAAELGGGSIWDVGCYPISYTRAMVGEEPEEAFGWIETGSSGVDLNFAGQLRFGSGILAQVSSGFRTPYTINMTFLGESGSLVIPRPFNPRGKTSISLRRGDVEEAISIDAVDLYLGEVEDLADAVLDGKAPRVSLADSRANTAAILALLESAHSGKPVKLNP